MRPQGSGATHVRLDKLSLRRVVRNSQPVDCLVRLDDGFEKGLHATDNALVVEFVRGEHVEQPLALKFFGQSCRF